MKTIVCYGDSNTWGDPPGGEGRYPWDIRWPGVLQGLLGSEFRVIEEGLNGRTTAIDDPTSDHRNGLTYLPVAIETHSPIDLFIIMLGTNDLKKRFGLSAPTIATGLEKLVQLSKSYGENVKATLIISPPSIVQSSDGGFRTEFSDSFETSRELALHYERVAKSYGCHFLNGGTVAVPSEIDGIHLDARNHAALAGILAKKVTTIFV